MRLPLYFSYDSISWPTSFHLAGCPDPHQGTQAQTIERKPKDFDGLVVVVQLLKSTRIVEHVFNCETEIILRSQYDHRLHHHSNVSHDTKQTQVALRQGM